MSAPALSRRAALKWLALSAASGALAGCAPQSASPALTPLPVIPRATWGAAEPDLNATGEHGVYDALTNPEGWLVYPEPLADALDTLVVHHSALPVSDGPLAIQTLHMQQRGFADIAYHFVIDDLGQIYEGRKITTRGAHTGGHNTGAVGIVLLGNFEFTQPTPTQLASLKALAQYLVQTYTLIRLAGHRDFQPGVTVCPGENLEPLLPMLASELGVVFGVG